MCSIVMQVCDGIDNLSVFIVTVLYIYMLVYMYRMVASQWKYLTFGLNTQSYTMITRQYQS